MAQNRPPKIQEYLDVSSVIFYEYLSGKIGRMLADREALNWVRRKIERDVKPLRSAEYQAYLTEGLDKALLDDEELMQFVKLLDDNWDRPGQKYKNGKARRLRQMILCIPIAQEISDIEIGIRKRDNLRQLGTLAAIDAAGDLTEKLIDALADLWERIEMTISLQEDFPQRICEKWVRTAKYHLDGRSSDGGLK